MRAATVRRRKHGRGEGASAGDSPGAGRAGTVSTLPSGAGLGSRTTTTAPMGAPRRLLMRAVVCTAANALPAVVTTAAWSSWSGPSIRTQGGAAIGMRPGRRVWRRTRCSARRSAEDPATSLGDRGHDDGVLSASAEASRMAAMVLARRAWCAGAGREDCLGERGIARGESEGKRLDIEQHLGPGARTGRRSRRGSGTRTRGPLRR